MPKKSTKTSLDCLIELITELTLSVNKMIAAQIVLVTAIHKIFIEEEE